jgi:hypothetical protein
VLVIAVSYRRKKFGNGFARADVTDGWMGEGRWNMEDRITKIPSLLEGGLEAHPTIELTLCGIGIFPVRER